MSKSRMKDKNMAWTYLVANLAVLPGLGSLMSARKSGIVQMLLAVSGFGISVYFVVRIIFGWAELIDDPNTVIRYVWKAAGGLLVFLTAWLWALVTSIRILRECGDEKDSRDSDSF
ncbi:MAG: hypothetical protein K9N52_08040 [Verrucomicrobia bacterium]|nr:hypothetical protein [Verrucomicrobiota bacterium]